MITFGVLFITTAALLYSIAIWTEKITKKLKRWIILTFGTAFCCDLVGTSTMFYLATNKFSIATHSVCGYMALIIMGVHLMWAVKTIRNPEKFEKLFNKFSVVAWTIWVIAFISGVPKI